VKREDILKVYEAGPEAVVDWVQGLIREFTAQNSVFGRASQDSRKPVEPKQPQLQQAAVIRRIQETAAKKPSR